MVVESLAIPLSLKAVRRLMATAFIRHHVADYAAWRRIYDAFTGASSNTGAAEPLVYRSVDDPNELLVIHNFAPSDDIAAWLNDPARRQAMSEAGVEGAPRIDLCLERLDSEPRHLPSELDG
jgi:hypothetical protein